MSNENQRSIIWATMDDDSLLRELVRLRSRLGVSLEEGNAYDAKLWRSWIEEIILERELRAEPPTLTAV